ncbi:hypothetical protein M9H77_02489 [Catharanthus roseus]|uniref:Uncharacterized protein n=1 Tax=Catharanthus roseus TaxID=4058 RepID=A0ACC0C8I9_CATRO|nr:hypothetical protein M9H77_02489 [Catharanthus roseus]
MPRKKVAKDFKKSVVNVTDSSSKEAQKLPNRVLSRKNNNFYDLAISLYLISGHAMHLKMIDLRRLPDMSVVKMILHDWNPKQMCSLKPREWVNGELKMNTMAILFLVKNYNVRLFMKLCGRKEVSCERTDLAFRKLCSMDSKINTSWMLSVFQLMMQIGALNNEIYC